MIPVVELRVQGLRNRVLTEESDTICKMCYLGLTI